MSAYREVQLLSAEAVEATGVGSEVDSAEGSGRYVPGSLEARLCLDVSAATAGDRTLDVEVYGVVGGAEFLIHAFEQVAAEATSQQSVVVHAVPARLVVRYTLPAGTGGDFDFAVHVVRG
jgi:hypothetical protein